ncbi:CrcB family protein [Natronosporangium hydrolyticum]|uniref:Fluoride-specific ion channel FluC n=1 Tax=Natronosporangium hydrolyticum TaxID=2811111 RepID=A0A895YKW3_9ACTN|nr:CrcB family protein [Natronosporangium hydrolyticum]QSB14740.1 CrcB family protein [Natronosporangium hydrolyticum]
MTAATWLLVLAGSMLGAPARYLADRWVQSWFDSAFPWGTWAVNVVGSAILGFVAAGAIAGAVPGLVMAGVGFGFCGALTTYSTFGYETMRLLETGSWLYAILNVVASVAAGLGAAFGAGALAIVLWG